MPSLAGNACVRENNNQEETNSSLGGDYQSLAGIPTLSTPFQLHIPRAIYDEMISQAFSELPNECCGLLAGMVIPPLPTEIEAPPTAQVKCRYPLANAAASAKEYLSDARSMFEAARDMRQRGIDILAVYHSH